MQNDESISPTSKLDSVLEEDESGASQAVISHPIGDLGVSLREQSGGKRFHCSQM